jgi:hypothetical protein
LPRGCLLLPLIDGRVRSVSRISQTKKDLHLPLPIWDQRLNIKSRSECLSHQFAPVHVTNGSNDMCRVSAHITANAQ